MPKDFSDEVEPRWTSRNTLKIFHTIKLVTIAFTTMDIATLVLVAIKPQKVVSMVPSTIKVAPTPANHIPRGDKLKSGSKSKNKSTNLSMPMLKLKE